MSCRVLLGDDALKEFSEITQWYEDERIGLGVEFVEEFEASLIYVKQFPGAFPIVHQKRRLRQVLMKRFPCLVLFVIHDTHVLVTRIIHAHRHPAKRVSKRRDL